MKILPLGAGQEVGRSCIIITIKNKTIMLDCGVHIGYQDIRKYPDFSFLSSTGDLNKIIDCVIISHFHLDHCGALVYLTEICGYNGPVFMTPPTKAVIPLLLEDYNKVMGDDTFTSQDIKNSIKKIREINIGETITYDGIEMTPYYAGHVLGAAMFYIKVDDETLVYTGDFNMTADKHLGSARIDCLKPDVLITECTYGSTVRDCRKIKEMEFLNSVHDCVERGGKVLIPTSAFGKAQELSYMVDAYWSRMKINVPIFSAAGLVEKATNIYKMYKSYTSEFIQNKLDNPFEYKNIQVLKSNFISDEGPVVLFSSPGVVHAGMTFSIFKKWCNDPKNMVIIPGYCVKGTVSERIANGAKQIRVGKDILNINLEVKNLGFSAHSDSVGIYKLIEQCQPKNIVLVHGEVSRMKIFKKKLSKVYKANVYYPKNTEAITINSSKSLKVLVEDKYLKYFDSDYEHDFIIEVNKNTKKIKRIEELIIFNKD
ncbi:YSH1, RNA processing exonuclease [Spraguea lophii 42_110]|uniref:YSH1, RNA processing exonuclease n=1 Tax=Spraguea lophii (strain 42_110) TaxID=1358809 RepID=S7XR15_SPRLO|nr:YSH1, RNA processing exonuclease [Spraguea lophii 42_110]